MPDGDAAFVERLRARALRAFARPEHVSRTFAAKRAVIGPRTSQLDALARAAHDRLSPEDPTKRRLPSAEQLAALELAIRLLRPAPLVQQGAVEDVPAFPLWDAFRAGAAALTAAVARVDRMEPDGFGGVRPEPVGSAFLVGPRLALTNRHVVWELANGGETLAPGMAEVSFRREYGSTLLQAPVPVTAVAAVHRELDLALLALSEDVAIPQAPLAFAPGQPDAGDAVVVVGYPGEDRDGNPVFVSPLFGDRFHVLRAAPGEVLEVGASTLHHDCTTLRGSSGSPVLAMSSGRVVGVHAGGRYLYRNEAVRGGPAERLVREAQP